MPKFFLQRIAFHNRFMSIAFTWLLFLAVIASGNDGVRAPTLQEVKQRHDHWRRHITSIICGGEMEGRTASTPPGVIRRSRFAVAASRRARFAEFQHLRDGFEWRDDVEWHRVYLRPGRLTVFWPVNCNAQISAKASDPFTNDKLEDVFLNVYMRCSGWWPPADEPYEPWDEPKGRFPCAPCFTFSSPSAVVGDRIIASLGRPCAVVTFQRANGTDTFWLDAERDFVQVRRSSSLDNGCTLLEIENADFKEVLPNTWLPCRVAQTLRWRPREHEPFRLKSRALVTVDRISVNRPVESRFAFTAPAGAIVHNRDSGHVDRVPGGVGILDNLVRIAKKEITAPTRRSVSGRAGRRNVLTVIALLPVIGVLLFVHLRCRTSRIRSAIPRGSQPSAHDGVSA